MPESVIVRDEGPKFQPHPEGQFIAQCVDSFNLGEKVKTFAGTPAKLVQACALAFRTGQKNEEGAFIDLIPEFTISMYERAKLRQSLESWRGKSYTVEQAEQGVDLEKLVHQFALISVEHRKSTASGRTYANIKSYSPVPQGMTLPTFPAYVRPAYMGERKAAYAAEAAAFRQAIGALPQAVFAGAPGADDDDLPF